MKRLIRKETRLAQIGAVTGLLIVGVAFCLFHFAHHTLDSNGMCPDPCSMMVSSLALALLAGPLPISMLHAEKPSRLYTIPMRLLVPPPEAWAFA